MRKTLLISFIVPAFNAQSTLTGCVRSIVRTMSSCRSSYEIIIVDDGSADDTPRLAQSLAEEIEEVTVVTQENRGLGAARNHGIDEPRYRSKEERQGPRSQRLWPRACSPRWR